MLFDDVSWLGKAHSVYGPAARACVGILIARDDWSWWHADAKGAVFDALQEVVPKHGVAAWGGDPAVMNLASWVRPAVAVRAAREFLAFAERFTYLRLKIKREVWDWPGFTAQAVAVKNDLACSFRGSHVVFEWPKDRRPRRPFVERGVENRLVITGMSALGKELVGGLDLGSWRGQWVADVNAADVVVATDPKELTSGRVVTDLAILLEDRAETVVELLDQIRMASGARCVVRLSPGAQAGKWLEAFGREWGFGGPVDDAVAVANEKVQLQGDVVASNQTFILRGVELGTTERPDERKMRAMSPPDIFSILRATSPKREPRALVLPETPRFVPPVARVLDAQLNVRGRRQTLFPHEGPYTIIVGIRLKSPLHKQVPFPDHLVQWDGDSRRLQVHLVEIDSEPVTHAIKVPRTGNSDSVVFHRQIASDRPIDIRFIVCDGAQILQTARLQGTPGGRFKFFIEAIASAVERESRQFDLSLLVNSSLGNVPSAATLTEDGIFVTLFDGNEIGNARDMFREEIELVVANPDLPPDEALIKLADKGGRLLKALKKRVPNWPEQIRRVQLMTKADAFFPFEYLYDGKVPEKPAAGLCPDRATCLTDDAPSHCPVRDAGKVLCPMGFLGVSAIIERQTWDSAMDKPLWLRLPKDTAQRRQISAIDKVVFAASKRADEFEDDEDGKLFIRIADVAKELGPPMPTWEDWKGAVAASNPAMLVFVAHVENDALMIGDDDALNFGAIDDRHLGSGAPLVIAIGCNSAIGRVALTSLPAVLLDEGARAVIAALTEVVGCHANEAALFLAKHLRDASKGSMPVAIGEYVTKLRRRFLAQDIALGLVLVAFGDADVALGGS